MTRTSVPGFLYPFCQHFIALRFNNLVGVHTRGWENKAGVEKIHSNGDAECSSALAGDFGSLRIVESSTLSSKAGWKIFSADYCIGDIPVYIRAEVASTSNLFCSSSDPHPAPWTRRASSDVEEMSACGSGRVHVSRIEVPP
jgi:hypothetical protein